MLNNASGFKHVYIASGYTDLREDMGSLAAMVKDYSGELLQEKIENITKAP